MNMTMPQAARIPSWRWFVPTVVICVAAIGVMWWLQTVPLPTACPAVYPAPLFCTEGARLTAAAVGSSVLVFLAVLMMVLSARISRDRRILAAGLVLTAVTAFAFVVYTMRATGISLF